MEGLNLFIAPLDFEQQLVPLPRFNQIGSTLLQQILKCLLEIRVISNQK